MAKAKGKAASPPKAKGELTVERSMADFRLCYRAKHKLVEREMEDHRFALGEQWSDDDKQKLEAAGFKPFTDNRIQPNLFLLTGLERQNRTDFKAFPEGEEDSVKAEIATYLFKDAIKKSGYQYKSSEQFKDGITCGESHLELYLDNTEDLINGKPCWKKIDGNMLFPDPACREYDFTDARYVYKVTLAIGREDLVNLYPDKQKQIEAASGGKLNFEKMAGTDTLVVRKRDYDKKGDEEAPGADEDETYDLIERFYKKYVAKIYVGDKQTGEIKEAESLDSAEEMVRVYKASIESDQQAFYAAVQGLVDEFVRYEPAALGAPLEQLLPIMQEAGMQLPPEPPEQDPERFLVIKRLVPEIWVFAHVPGIDKPLSDARAWCYPKWKSYPFTPYYCRYSTAPLTGDDRHLLVQGIVHGVKGAQERHNKAEMLMLRHLNTSANSGWLAHEDAWVDEALVKKFGSAPGINLPWKGSVKPERITPTTISPGHAEISAGSAAAIKEQLGINADLLATQQGGTDSGRAIALRQRQGLLMVQEPFDNLSRTRKRAGELLLSQLGEIYDTETAMKVLGEAFLKKHFPPLMLPDPNDPAAEPKAMPDEMGRPMEYDKKLAEVAIAEVLKGDLGVYNVSVGEAVASETQRMANSAELQELSTKMPIPPEVMIRHSQLPETTKTEILTSLQQAQAAAAAMAGKVPAARPPVEAAA